MRLAQPLLVSLSVLFLGLTPVLGEKNVCPDGSRVTGSLTVEGSSSARIVPDIGEVQLGIFSTQETAEDARKEVAVSAEKVYTALESINSTNLEIKTANVRLIPNYESYETGIVSNYTFSNDLIITVRDSQGDLGSTVAKVIDDSITAQPTGIVLGGISVCVPSSLTRCAHAYLEPQLIPCIPFERSSSCLMSFFERH